MPWESDFATGVAMPPPNENGDWLGYRRLILSELERLTKGQEELGRTQDDIRETLAEMRGSIASMNSGQRVEVNNAASISALKTEIDDCKEGVTDYRNLKANAIRYGLLVMLGALLMGGTGGTVAKAAIGLLFGK